MHLHSCSPCAWLAGSTNALCFVELPGSERLQKSAVPRLRNVAPAEMSRLRELDALRRVLKALRPKPRARPRARAAFVPWRDSLLTRLLKDALGYGRVACVAACAPSRECRDETVSTLRFARVAAEAESRPLRHG